MAALFCEGGPVEVAARNLLGCDSAATTTRGRLDACPVCNKVLCILHARIVRPEICSEVLHTAVMPHMLLLSAWCM